MVPRHNPFRAVVSTCAFSLLELIIVIAVLGVLVMVSIQVVDGVNRRCMIARCRAELDYFDYSLIEYTRTFGVYPESVLALGEHGEDVLLRVLRLSGNVSSNVSASLDMECDFDVVGGRILDPWDNPYVYSYQRSWLHGQYFLLSMGPDGQCRIDESSGRYDEFAELNLDNVEVFR